MSEGGIPGLPATDDHRPADQRPAAVDLRTSRPRPILIEVASAFLVVGAVLNLFLSVDALTRIGQQGGEIGPIVVITLVLNVGLLGLGVLVRFGYAWLITINVVAVVAFLELISGTIVGLLFGAVDVFVVLALVQERPWFEWSARRRSDEEAARAGIRR